MPARGDSCAVHAENMLECEWDGRPLGNVVLCRDHTRLLAGDRVAEVDLWDATLAWQEMELHCAGDLLAGTPPCSSCQQASLLVNDAISRQAFGEVKLHHARFCAEGRRLLEHLGQVSRNYADTSGLTRRTRS